MKRIACWLFLIVSAFSVPWGPLRAEPPNMRLVLADCVEVETCHVASDAQYDCVKAAVSADAGWQATVTRTLDKLQRSPDDNNALEGMGRLLKACGSDKFTFQTTKLRLALNSEPLVGRITTINGALVIHQAVYSNPEYITVGEWTVETSLSVGSLNGKNVAATGTVVGHKKMKVASVRETGGAFLNTSAAPVNDLAWFAWCNADLKAEKVRYSSSMFPFDSIEGYYSVKADIENQFRSHVIAKFNVSTPPKLTCMVENTSSAAANFRQSTNRESGYRIVAVDWGYAR